MRKLQAKPYGHAKRNKKGQGLTESGIVVVLSTLIFLGIVEFGYVLMALNTVTQATSAGARAASVVQMGSRSLCGQIPIPVLLMVLRVLCVPKSAASHQFRLRRMGSW